MSKITSVRAIAMFEPVAKDHQHRHDLARRSGAT